MWFLFGAVTTAVVAMLTGYWRYAWLWKGSPGPGFQYAFGTSRYGKLLSLNAGVDHGTPFDFELRLENAVDRLFKDAGLSVEQQVGDPAFDKTIYLVSDDAMVRMLFETSNALRHAAMALLSVTSLPPSRICCRSGRVWVEASVRRYDKAGALNEAVIVFAPHLQTMAAELCKYRGSEAAKRDPLFFKSILVLGLTAGLAINGFVQLIRQLADSMPYTLDKHPLLVMSVFAGVLMLVALVLLAFRLLGRTSRLHRALFQILLLGVFGAWSTSYTGLSDINMDLDTRAPRVYSSMVINKSIEQNRKRGPNYYLYVGKWREGVTDKRLPVSSSVYATSSIGRPVAVRERDGALGIRWVEWMQPR